MSETEIQKLFVDINENKYKKALKIVHNTFNVDKNFVLSCLKHCKDNDSKRNLINQYKLLGGGKKIKAKIFVGPESDSIFVIYPNNIIYALGENKNFQLGLGHNKKINKPERVKVLNLESIKEIYPSKEYSLFLTENKQLYFIGNKFIGRNIKNVEFPYRQIFSYLDVKKICVSDKFFIILTNSSKVILVYLEKNFIIEELDGSKYFDKDDDDLKSFNNIINIEELHRSFLCLTKDNKLFVFEYQYLSKNIYDVYKIELSFKENFIKKIGAMNSPFYGIVLLTKRNELFFMVDFNKAKLLIDPKFRKKFFTDFFCTKDRLIAIASDNTVYVFGDNKNRSLLKFENEKKVNNINDLTKVSYFEDEYWNYSSSYYELTKNTLLENIKKFYLTKSSTYYVNDQGYIMQFGDKLPFMLGIGPFDDDDDDDIKIVNQTRFEEKDIETEEMKKKMRSKKAQKLSDVFVKTSKQ
jgi:alpha-tubulin suppressor-like RCC1 family protein